MSTRNQRKKSETEGNRRCNDERDGREHRRPTQRHLHLVLVAGEDRIGGDLRPRARRGGQRDERQGGARQRVAGTDHLSVVHRVGVAGGERRHRLREVQDRPAADADDVVRPGLPRRRDGGAGVVEAGLTGEREGADLRDVMFNIMTAILDEWGMTSSGRRKLRRAHDLKLLHETKFSCGHSAPDFVIEACGPSFQLPEHGDLGFSNITTCITIDAPGSGACFKDIFERHAVFAR